MSRIFVGTFLNNNLVEQIKLLKDSNHHLSDFWGKKFNFTSLEKLHLTWLFLGIVEKANLVKIHQGLETMIDNNQEEFIKNKAKLILSFDQVEFWPNPQSPKTLVVTTNSLNDAVISLQSKIQRAIFPFIEPKVRDQALRPFKPHITIARFYSESNNISAKTKLAIKVNPNPKLPPKLNVNDIRLLRKVIPLELKLADLSIVESNLTNKKYSTLAQLPLFIA